ncbi:hypothetical protein [Actinoplanes sp. NPDC020271]|uniref:hypothetical protein n=1 Tax=Actinoplanes sp. NPDC020271 TaxID=3363896 RepID=UPI00378F33DB
MVIATAMLTILGMIGGYLLNQHRKQSSASSSGTSSATPAEGESSSPPTMLPTEGECTSHTQKMARDIGAIGILSQVLRVTTDRGSVVWICQDDGGNLFYHANKGGEKAKWVEGSTALFLPGVEHEPDGSFRAVASWDGTTFDVNTERLLITRGDVTVRSEKVVGG